MTDVDTSAYDSLVSEALKVEFKKGVLRIACEAPYIANGDLNIEELQTSLEEIYTDVKNDCAERIKGLTNKMVCEGTHKHVRYALQKGFGLDYLEDPTNAVHECVAQEGLDCYRGRLWCFDLDDTALNGIHAGLLDLYDLQGFNKQLKLVLDKIKESSNRPITPTVVGQLAFELEKLCVQTKAAKHRPGVILFEREKFKLKPLQTHDIELVLQEESKNLILQRIMSYGKTDVLGVLMTFLKARSRLSILVLPSSLYKVNSVDMISKARRLFHQRGHAVAFGRSDRFSSVERLELLLTTILDAHDNHGFLTMTAETIQMMQNKFIELLDVLSNAAEPSKDPLLLQRFKLLRKILQRIREWGAPTFDEVDLIFTPFKELNFPLNLAPSMDRGGLLAAGYVILLAASDADMHSRAGLVHNRQAQMKDEESFRNVAIERLIDKLFLDKIDDELHTTLRRELGIYDLYKAATDDQAMKQVNDFFAALHPMPSLPEFLAKADARVLERWLMLWHQIRSWMVDAFKKTCNEHFGPAPEQANYEAAVPYLAAKTPNKGSEFVSSSEVFNKTLMMLIIDGFSAQQLAKLVAHFQVLADGEMRTRGIKKEQTSAWRMLDSVFNDENLFTDDFDLGKGVEHVNKCLKLVGEPKQRAALQLVLYHVVDIVMPNVKFYHEQITNNTLCMVDSAFQSMQGYTGTIPNPFVFPEALQKHIVQDEGANGMIMHRMLTLNNTIVILQEGLEDVSKAVDDIIDETKAADRLHALIDIGAHLKNYTNEAVARALLAKLHHIEAVIFFDEHNRLAYVKRDKEGIGRLEGSDSATLDNVIGVKRRKRFTFYDQRHCTGTDISQPLSSVAVATIGTLTTLRDALQGFFRMRKLLDDPAIAQRIVIGVTPSLASFIRTTIGKQGDLDMVDILRHCQLNAENLALVENTRVAYLKMSSYARTAAMRKLMEEEVTLENRKQIYKSSRGLFVRTRSSHLRQMQAELDSMNSIAALEAYYQTLLQTLAFLTDEERKAVGKRMTDLVEHIRTMGDTFPKEIPVYRNSKVAAGAENGAEQEQERTGARTGAAARAAS